MNTTQNPTQNQRGNSELNSELKPCPFCGGKAKVKVCDGSGSFFADIGTEMYQGRKMTHCLVRCERCRVKTQAYLTRRGVFNAWNRRAADVVPRAKIAEIFEEIEDYIDRKLALLIGVIEDGEVTLAFKALLVVQDYLVELKKKYTEGKT